MLAVTVPLWSMIPPDMNTSAGRQVSPDRTLDPDSSLNKSSRTRSHCLFPILLDEFTHQ